MAPKKTTSSIVCAHADAPVRKINHARVIGLSQRHCPAAGVIPQEVYEESFREFIFGNNTRGHSGPSRTRDDSYLWTKQFLNTNPSSRLAEWARMIVADYEEDIKHHEIEEDELEHG
jgi:hypothetical protein